MTNLPCARCGIRERKISRSGKQLSYCDECNRNIWRKYKTPQQNGELVQPEKSHTHTHKTKSNKRADEMEQLRRELIESRLEVARLRRTVENLR